MRSMPAQFGEALLRQRAFEDVAMLQMLAGHGMTCLGVTEGCFEGPTYLSRVVALWHQR